MMADTGAALPAATLRRDPWWLEILPTIALLGGFTLYALCHLREQSLLRGALPLAVLLPVPGGPMPASDAAARRPLVDPVAGAAGLVGPAGLPRHVLLLPQSVLSRILLGASRLRRARAPQGVCRGDP